MTPAARAAAYAGFGAVLGFTFAAALFARPSVQTRPPQFAEDTPPPAATQTRPEPAPARDIAFAPVAFSDLPAWADHDPRPGIEAFRRSCERILLRPDDASMAPRATSDAAKAAYGAAADWKPACEALQGRTFAEADGARAWIVERFTPHALKMDDAPIRELFTGYYEPELEGSRVRTEAYPWPALAPPRDLVTVDVADFEGADSTIRLRGRVTEDNRLKPYPARGAIEGRFTEDADAVVWLKDRADLFFLHIQGSGRVRLPDGGVMRIGYAADNGRAYRSIGRELIRRGVFEAHEASLERIKAWLREAPAAEAAALYAENPSFIFFEERAIAGPDLGPLGAMGVSLTPDVSLAVDPAFHAYGPMTWFATQRPRLSGPGGEPWAGLGVFQDTGSAIKGAGRVDVFYGWGAEAETRAGRMKYDGRLWVFLPRAESDKARAAGDAR